MRTPRSYSLAVLALILLSPRLSDAQSSMCAPVSNNPLVMANLCSPAPAIERTPSKSPARPLTLTVEQVDKMVLDSSPLIHPGDFLLFETNRRDFVLHLLLSNGKEIVTQPLTREDAEDTSVAWRQGRIRLDYPETLNERIVRYRLVLLHPEGTPLLIRGIKIDGKGKLTFELEKSIPGAAKPAPIEPPMSYPPDPHVMTASASKPDIWGRQQEPGFLAPKLPSYSIHPMMFQSTTTSTGDPNHFKWNGKELDDETGLYNFGARYYSPALGRFVTPDPKIISKQRMRDPQQWNMYSYSRNNPTSMFDPDGKEVTTLLTGQDYKNLVNALAQSYRKESFRSAFKDLKSNPMVHEFGKMKTTYTPVAPGSVVVNANPGATDLLGAQPGKNGTLDFSHAHTEIKVDLDRGDAAHVESHEVEHGVQAQTDPAGYADASTKGAGSPEYDKLDNQAEDFANKVEGEKPTMSLKEATKEVQKLLPEPKPNPKKEDQK